MMENVKCVCVLFACCVNVVCVVLYACMRACGSVCTIACCLKRVIVE